MATTVADPETSDAAVQRATGKTWSEWRRELDDAGCREASHPNIVAAAREAVPELSPWWSQTVAVGYERMVGLRDANEKADGYAVSVSRTIDASITVAFRAFKDGRSRKRWLTEPITIRKATPDRSLRISWDADGTTLDVNLTSKGTSRCEAVVQHSRLPDIDTVETMRAFWRERMDTLRDLLEQTR